MGESLHGSEEGERIEILSQAAGALRFETSSELVARRFYALWAFVSDRLLPGATVERALIEKSGNALVDDDRLRERLRASRGVIAVELPVAGPMVARCPRTGRPAQGKVPIGGKGEFVDRATLARRGPWRKGQQGVSLKLERDFLGDELKDYSFVPRTDDIKESNDIAAEVDVGDGLTSEGHPYVGVIHADGNAIGRLIKDLNISAPPGCDVSKRFKDFSDNLKDATKNAARTAVREVLVDDARRGKSKKLRARPVVLGGDDLTILVAGDLAVRFAVEFCKAFEKETCAKLGYLEHEGLTGFDGLTACAGITLAKRNFPFDRAYHLAESLCKHAKNTVKYAREIEDKNGEPKFPAYDRGSAVAFYRVTTSLPGDAKTVFDTLTVSESHHRRVTLEAYSVGKRREEGQLVPFEKVDRLANEIPLSQRGRFRNVIDILQERPNEADAEVGRMLDVLRVRGEGNAADDFVNALAKIHGRPEDDDSVPLWRTRSYRTRPANEPNSIVYRTALLDAYTLCFLREKQNEDGRQRS